MSTRKTLAVSLRLSNDYCASVEMEHEVDYGDYEGSFTPTYITLTVDGREIAITINHQTPEVTAYGLGIDGHWFDIWPGQESGTWEIDDLGDDAYADPCEPCEPGSCTESDDRENQ
jgi:hypothetical protein